jgi:hypothetical protein
VLLKDLIDIKFFVCINTMGILHCPFIIHRQSALLLLVWRPYVVSRVAFSASSCDGGSYTLTEIAVWKD